MCPLKEVFLTPERSLSRRLLAANQFDMVLKTQTYIDRDKRQKNTNNQTQNM